jgi:hypothetical protein
MLNRVKIPVSSKLQTLKHKEAENGLGIGDLYIITYQKHKELSSKKKAVPSPMRGGCSQSPLLHEVKGFVNHIFTSCCTYKSLPINLSTTPPNVQQLRYG